jgi:hypothetical protein
MINRATPVPGTEQLISSLTIIAKCFCGSDLVRLPTLGPIDEVTPAFWYHFKTGRGLCNVGIHPSQIPVDHLTANL